MLHIITKRVHWISLEQNNDAIAVYNQALDLDPAHTPSLHYKGVALTRIGRFEEAIKAFDRTLEIDGSFAEAWFDKGKALASLGMYREGVRAFDKALISPLVSRSP